MRRLLSRQNDEWLAGLQLATTEDFTSTSADGTVVNGLVVKPEGSAPGTKLPTVLEIHGGPNRQDEHSFSLERELLAAGGYAVLAVNHRDSLGRGSAFQKAVFGDGCHYEVVDLLGAVDQAVKSGLADPERLGTGGWSYGGILTDALVATDTRFAAAWSGAGSALQLSMYGTDPYVVQHVSELGPPWKGLALPIGVWSALYTLRDREPYCCPRFGSPCPASGLGRGHRGAAGVVARAPATRSARSRLLE